MPLFRRKKYRKNAAVVVTDGKGHVLLCERFDKPGMIQTVQGGINEGEDAQAAALRELKEELGLDVSEVELKASLLGTYKYEWTPAIQKKMAQLNRPATYAGQEQYYFLAEVDPQTVFNLSSEDREFSRVWWGAPEELLAQIWHRKRPGLEAALKGFGLIKQ